MGPVGNGMKSLARGVGGLLQDISHRASTGAGQRKGDDARRVPRPFGAWPQPVLPGVLVP